MKFLFTIILLVGFISMAVFGVFSMHAGMQNHDGGCIAATAQGTDCPKQTDHLDYLAFHLDVYKGFSLATFRENAMGGLLIALAPLLFISLAFFSMHLFKPPQIIFYKYRFRDSFVSSQKQKFTRWLSLHENSPAVF